MNSLERGKEGASSCLSARMPGLRRFLFCLGSLSFLVLALFTNPVGMGVVLFLAVCLVRT